MSSPKAALPPLLGLLFAAAAAITAAACTPIPTQDRGSGAGRPNDGPAANAAPARAGSSPALPAASEVGGATTPTAEGSKGGAPRAVVVELFTSEGCSSCPPADDLLREMAADARSKGDPIYFLAFHVDYWNDLGWPDPFSARTFTERQRAYAALTGASGVYTPQMIINGRNSFVGSDGRAAHLGVSEALTSPTSGRAAVSLAAAPKSPGGAGESGGALKDVIDVVYNVAGAPPGSVLNLALVEDGLNVRVLRGENAGKTLIHDATVRLFRSFALDKGASGSASLAWPEGMNRGRASLVAYAQEKTTLDVLGASSMKLQ